MNLNSSFVRHCILYKYILKYIHLDRGERTCIRTFNACAIFCLTQSNPLSSVLLFWLETKLYIPSTISAGKKLLRTAIWAGRKGLVVSRLACTSSNDP